MDFSARQPIQAQLRRWRLALPHDGGVHRTIGRHPVVFLLLGALLLAAVGAGASAAADIPTTIEGASSTNLPEGTDANSVAVAADGTAWFGVSTEGGGPQLVRVRLGKIAAVRLPGGAKSGWTSQVTFDLAGNLWFVRKNPSGTAIVRRSPSGAISATRLPRGGLVTGLAPGPEGEAWFTRGYGGSGAIGRVSATGQVTTIPLARESIPSSVAVGADGAAWFTERRTNEVGRVTTTGDLQLFPLDPGTHPGQIVAGVDGALWFAESGSPLPGGKRADRIGRIATDGTVSQFAIPFGESTVSLAADPRGVIWFTTEVGEISSISPSGSLGAHGCLRTGCASRFGRIAVAPDGGIWFTASGEGCSGCGGGATLMQENLGTPFGEIPPGALAPPA